MRMFSLRFLPLLAAMACAPAVAGCGHSDEEMAAKQRTIDQMKRDMASLNAKMAEQHEADDKKFRDSQDELDKLKSRLRELTSGLESSKEEIDKLKQAKAEYEQRAAQLEELKKRFRDLRARIAALGAKLTAQGLTVKTRNNRMVIQLPGDVLFPSGMDTLQPDGKKVLKQVADIIKGDSTLGTRVFQVAGHTDNVEYGQGVFRDNWGLSVARARTVLVFLVSPNTKPQYAPANPPEIPYGGALDPKNWSAAGYGIMDPQAGTVERQTDAEKAKNRRVELVLQPNVEEMLDIKNLGGD